MKYAYTILYVDDVEMTARFYSEAFGFKPKFITDEKDYAELSTGEVTIAFASHGLGKSNFRKGYTRLTPGAQPIGVEMAFTSENIEQDIQQALDAGAELFEPLAEKPWGQKVAYLRDINGFLIEVCTPMPA